MNSTDNFSLCIISKNLSNFSMTMASLKYFSEISFLSIFNVFVILGNCLVLAALAVDRQLRTPTHYFIGSLAVADLALGIFVLPFATALQIRGYWSYGSLLCQTWLAFDVWLCTASIYSLIAVTFDRYVAVTKPLTYRLVLTKRKANILIIAVWTASLIICLPAFAFSLHRSYRLTAVSCQCTQMAHSAVYIAYSSTGSFYLPMVIIVFLYARIYTTVRKIKLSGSTGIVSMAKSAMTNGACVATTGSLSHKQHQSLLDRGPQLSATLRVHKGKYQPAKCGSKKKKGLVNRFRHGLSISSDTKPEIDIEPRQPLDQEDQDCMKHEIVVQEPQEEDPEAQTVDGMVINRLDISPIKTPILNFNKRQFHDSQLDMRYLTPSQAPSCQSSASNSPRGSMTETKLLEKEISMAASQTAANVSGATNPATAAADLWLHIIMPSHLTSIWCQRMAVFQKYQRKFALELKALKTVGIVTGCFFACWLGFCIVYTMQAMPNCRRATLDTLTLLTKTASTSTGTILSSTSFSSTYSSIGSCVPDWVTNIMMWLGYVNSAMNPIIYGVSNKQFRRTFRRILRCDVLFKNGSQKIRRKSDACIQKSSLQ